MPRIIPVLDILGGLAVHARAGRRADYRPVRSVLRGGPDPSGLAVAMAGAVDARELYLADLDAIDRRAPDLALYARLAALGLAPWIDAGLRDGSGVDPILEADPGRVVVGLETVAGPAGLAGIVARAGAGRVVFSLDLRGGRSIVAGGADWGTRDPSAIARAAIEAGVGTVIVLDLADVGLGGGPGTLGLVAAMAVAHPAVAWVVGGGVAGPDDLGRIGRAGASAALVGSAIHDGTIGTAEARAALTGRDESDRFAT